MPCVSMTEWSRGRHVHFVWESLVITWHLPCLSVLYCLWFGIVLSWCVRMELFCIGQIWHSICDSIFCCCSIIQMIMIRGSKRSCCFGFYWGTLVLHTPLLRMIVLEDGSKRHSSDGSYLESMDTILGILMVWCGSREHCCIGYYWEIIVWHLCLPICLYFFICTILGWCLDPKNPTRLRMVAWKASLYFM